MAQAKTVTLDTFELNIITSALQLYLKSVERQANTHAKSPALVNAYNEQSANIVNCINKINK